RMSTQHRNRLDIGLDSSTAAGIGTSNDQDSGGLRRHLSAIRLKSLSSRNRFANSFDQPLDHFRVVTLRHDPDQRLGARFSDHQPAARPKLGFGPSNGAF